MGTSTADRINLIICSVLLLLLLPFASARAQHTIHVTTTNAAIDFDPLATEPGTLARPAWDMQPQAWNGGEASPSTGIWIAAGGGGPSVDELVADLATRGDGLVSLREAIVIANASQYAGSESGTTTVVLAPGATYTLTEPDNWWYGANALPPIHAHIVIEGQGATIRRANAADVDADRFRLLYVAGKFHNLVDGKSPPAGAPAFTEGHLVLRDVTLRNGRARGGHSHRGGGGAGLGGAIYNQGRLELDGVTLRDNRAEGGSTMSDGEARQAGGGIFGDARTHGGGGFRDGGIDGITHVGGGFVTREPRAEGGDRNDIADGPGSAVGSRGSSRFGGDGADGHVGSDCPAINRGSGGGFLSSATASTRGDGGGTTANCEAGGGGAFGGGGGAALTVAATGPHGGAGGVGGGGGGSSPGGFPAGAALRGGDGGFGAGAGTGAYGGFGGGSGLTVGPWGFGGGGGGVLQGYGGGGAGFGGALFNHHGHVSIVDSTLTGNAAVGGSHRPAFPGGAPLYGSGGAGYGGAIFNLNGEIEIVASDLSGNTVTGGTAQTGDVADAAGGAIFNHAQGEDVGVADLRNLRGVTWSPSLTRVTLIDTPLSGSIGGSDCAASGAQRQRPATSVAYAAEFTLDAASTIADDAAGIRSCDAFRLDAVRFTFSLEDNAEGDFAAQGWLDPDSAFQANLRAAADAYTRRLGGSALLRVRVAADRSETTVGASAERGWVLTPSTPPLREPSALSKIRTGASPTRAYDMGITINVPAVATGVWIDPTPADRGDTPAGQRDLQSILLHELMHGLGVYGGRGRAAANHGQFLDWMSPFDELTQDGLDGLEFVGGHAQSMFDGMPVPVTHWGSGHPNSGSDFYHLATTCHATDDPAVHPILRDALMTACPFPQDGRYKSLTGLDIALLRDIGYEEYALEIVSVTPDPALVGLPTRVRVHLRGHETAPLGQVTIADDAGSHCIAPLAPLAESDGRTAAGECDIVVSEWSLWLQATYAGSPLHPPRASAQVPITVTDSVALRYTAGEHGSLSGPLLQSVPINGSGSPVTATPDAGYVFAGWSDGRQDSPRVDSNVQAPVDVLALFAAQTTFTLTYTAGPNGSLVGSAVQQVAGGGNGSPVLAVANAGHRFVGWSDGRNDNPRTDVDVLGSMTVEANFALAPDAIFANGFE